MGLTIKQVAAELGCGIDHVRALIAAGELRAVDIGLGRIRRRRAVLREHLDDFKERRSSLPSPSPRRKRAAKPTTGREWV